MEPEPNQHVVEARATRNWVGADGIVRSQVRADCDFDETDSAEALSAARRLGATLPTPVLVDARGVRSATRASRLFWEGPEARATLSAMAVVVGNPVSRMVASFFIRLVRPGFELAIFDSEADAVAWLRTFLR